MRASAVNRLQAAYPNTHYPYGRNILTGILSSTMRMTEEMAARGPVLRA